MKALLRVLAFVSFICFVHAVPTRPSASLPPRETINFDFGWRFLLGDPDGQFLQCGGAEDFPTDYSNVECLGLHSAQVSNADECRDVCCSDIMCQIWQYAHDQGCWIGTSDDCNHPNKDWVGGGGRKTPAPLPKPDPSGPASTTYDDSKWELIDAPHDPIVKGQYNSSNYRGRGFLAGNITWYRKHFNLPSEWNGQSIWVYFEGVFRTSTVYFNNQSMTYHDSGYTSFSVRLDNASKVNYGDGASNENVIVIRADATHGSGWWYEGGGLYRHNYLVAAGPVHATPDGVYGACSVTGNIKAHNSNDHSQGMWTDKAEFYPQVEVANDASTKMSVSVAFTLYNMTGEMIYSIDKDFEIDASTVMNISTSFYSENVELWSINRPYLYTLETKLTNKGANPPVVSDAVNVTIGARRTKWDPDNGFYLNDANFIWRGFNNHNDFAGVGMAVPDRVNLFRAQSMRAVGGNAWRMSHNPPIPMMLDILDRVGIVVWDENRNFGDNDLWVQAEGDMVKRDRNHPSIMIWSFCNEVGCNLDQSIEKKIGSEFSEISYHFDSFRPVSANQISNIGGGLSSVIDVQGFSHRGGSDFDKYHQQFPQKPLIGSECCSCTTQRGEDYANKSAPNLGNFNANCNQGQTENQLNRKFVAGCMVWTLFDYYGEPSFGWPHISSSFGSIDLAGFAKASAYWYRAWWLYSGMQNASLSGEDVPLNPPCLVNPQDVGKTSQDNAQLGYLVHIVQRWEPRPGATSYTIQVYTNAPMVDLAVNSKSQGPKMVNWQGWAEWDNVPYSEGQIEATAMDSNKKVVASQSVETSGPAAKVLAYVDAPSDDTATGKALVLDGQDAGMVSAVIVDSKGNVVPSSFHNVTFSIVSGPGRIIGVGNGNPACHDPNNATWRNAYHGLARAIVQVTQDQATSPLHRQRLIEIDRDGGIHTYILPPEKSSDAESSDDSIVVQAAVEGLGSATVSIPVTTDIAAHSVLAVANRLH